MLRVVLAGQHKMVRDGLREVIERDGDMEVVAESDGEGVERYTRGHKPDVLVVDSLDGDDWFGVEEISPQTKVVFVCDCKPDEATAAVRAGASVVNKEDGSESLISAIRSTCDGKSYVSPSMAVAIARYDINSSGLTEREQGILRLIALGYTNGEIAEVLFLSIRTIESHRANIQRKIDANKRHEMVAYAMEHNLVTA